MISLEVDYVCDGDRKLCEDGQELAQYVTAESQVVDDLMGAKEE
eukprot:CAMPEP_0170181776 /NCGR_PEP_ID=MMETSP0040_2-20121228/25998_1 /TAXON_ID=641309 /ORGANISM="Lotharella oceanica, Strain CCMP622" /LENGTH=43 /DNA_ID= /DNA_START= /DNA_END= /DNA_ORIENTATION=